MKGFDSGADVNVYLHKVMDCVCVDCKRRVRRSFSWCLHVYDAMMPSVTVCFALTAQFDFVDDTDMLSLQLRAYALGTSWFSRHRTMMDISMSDGKLCRVACLWYMTAYMPGFNESNSRAESVSPASIVIPMPM